MHPKKPMPALSAGVSALAFKALLSAAKNNKALTIVNISNTVVLVAGVSLGVMLLGVGTAWLVTACRFPGQRALEWTRAWRGLDDPAPAFIRAGCSIADALSPVCGPVRAGGCALS